MDKINVITLLFLIIAVVVILKLRSVLGRRTGDEEARIERRTRMAEEAKERAAAIKDKVVAMPRREREGGTIAAHDEVSAADAEARVKSYAPGNAALQTSLVELARHDPTFDPEHFLRGAKQAYEMIVTGFAEGNRKLLKDLLSREVYEGFVSAITERENRGEQIDQSFVGINRAEIVEAEIKNQSSQVTVNFVSQLISATRDTGGQVIAGDPQRIRDVTDIWTFAREIGSRDPNWRLIATQAPA